MNGTEGIPFVDFNGNQYVLLKEEEKQNDPKDVDSSEGSFASIKFNVNFSALGNSTAQLFVRLFSLRDQGSNTSSLLASDHSEQNTSEAPSSEAAKGRLFCCIKERNPFHITCHTNTNYALSGFGREMRIKYSGDDLLLMGYSVALLDFLYKNKDTVDTRSGELCFPIALRAKEAKSDTDFNKILQDRASLETMIVWFKTMGNPGATYNFDEQSQTAIQSLFYKIGLSVNVAKQKPQSSLCFRSNEVEEILKDVGASGELVMRGNNLVSYFSG